MKLSWKSIPYRAASKLGTILIIIAFSSGVSPLGNSPSTVLIALGGIIGTCSLFLGYEYLYWRKYEFLITEEGINITSGVLTRNDRDIPLRRIQNVDVDRNLIQRILGIAKLNIETAGGGQTEASLKYLEKTDAEEIKKEVRSLKDRRDNSEKEGSVKERRIREKFELSNKNLAILSAVSIDFRIVGAFGIILSVAGGFIGKFIDSTLGSMASFFILFLVLIGLVASLWISSALRTMEKFYGFKLIFGENALEYERGLFNRASGTIPEEKIQNLVIEENFLQRYFGYATLKIETAGFSAQQQLQKSAETAIPLAKTKEIKEFAEQIGGYKSPELREIDSRARIRYFHRYLIYAVLVAVPVIAGVAVVDLSPVPLLIALGLALVSRKAAELKWQNIGYASSKDHVFTRKGFWNRKTYAVPYFRIQNLMRVQTILQKRWDQETLEIDTAGSMLSRPRIIDMDRKNTEELNQQLFQKFKKSL